jgi:hypothetical protein
MRNAFSRWEAMIVLAVIVILCVLLYPESKSDRIEDLIAQHEISPENSLELDEELLVRDLEIAGTWKSQNDLYALTIQRKQKRSNEWNCEWIIYPDSPVEIVLNRQAHYRNGVLRVRPPMMELKDRLVFDRFFASQNLDKTPVLVASVIVKQFEDYLDQAGEVNFTTESLIFTRLE